MKDLKPDTPYWTQTLPQHWIYQDATGLLWMFPASPAGPEALKMRSRYKGPTGGLKEARPATIARIYFPRVAPTND